MKLLCIKLPTVDKCCFCVDLKLGTTILAWVITIISALCLVLVLLGTAHITPKEKHHDDSDDKMFYQIMFFLAIVILGLELSVGILLLICIYANKRDLARIAIIIYAILIAVNILYLVGGVLVLIWSSVIGSIIFICLNIYLLIVINSYYEGGAGEP